MVVHAPGRGGCYASFAQREASEFCAIWYAAWGTVRLAVRQQLPEPVVIADNADPLQRGFSRTAPATLPVSFSLLTPPGQLARRRTRSGGWWVRVGNCRPFRRRGQAQTAGWDTGLNAIHASRLALNDKWGMDYRLRYSLCLETLNRLTSIPVAMEIMGVQTSRSLDRLPNLNHF